MRTILGVPLQDPPPLRRWMVVAVVYASVRISVEAASRWLLMDAGSSLWYPPAGVDVVLLLAFGLWMIPAVVVTQTYTVLTAPFSPPTPWLLAYIALHVCLYAVLVHFAARKLRVDPRLSTGRDALIFAAAMIVGLPLVVGPVKSGFLVAAGMFAPGQWLTEAAGFVTGDATGIAMVAPAALVALRGVRLPDGRGSPAQPIRSPWSFPWSRWVEAAVIGLALALTVHFGLVRHVGVLDLRPLLVLPVAWAALRYGFTGAALTVLGLNVMLVTDWHLAPPGDLQDAAAIQLTLGSVSVAGIFLGGLVEDDRRLRRIAEESTRRFDGAFRATPDAILLISLPDRRIVEVNPAFTALSGWSAADAVGKTTDELGVWTDPADLQRHRRDYGRGPVRDSEFTLQSKSGRQLQVAVSTEDYRANGQHYLLSVCRDLTPQRRAEAQVLEASEGEQRRLGRELHDDVGQRITGLRYLADALAASLSEGPEIARDRANTIAEQLGQTSDQLRVIAHGLHPTAKDENDVARALETLARDVSSQFGAQVTFDASASPRWPPGDRTSIHLYRLAQEALVNARRHGNAEHVTLRLDAGDEPDTYVLDIEDDGVGLSADWSEEGMGLATMRYRAAQLSGTLEVIPTESGTRVSCRFRVPRQDPSEPEPLAP